MWTNDLRRGHRLAHRIETGMLWLNSHNVRDLRTPFGGVKESGLGREGGQHSLDFYTDTTIVHVALGDTHVPRFGASASSATPLGVIHGHVSPSRRHGRQLAARRRVADAARHVAAGRPAPRRAAAIEDEAITELVAKEEAVGLPAVTDGEFRRDWWHLDFLAASAGSLSPSASARRTSRARGEPADPGRRRQGPPERPIFIDAFTYLASVVVAIPKITIPGPGMANFMGGRR